MLDEWYAVKDCIAVDPLWAVSGAEPASHDLMHPIRQRTIVEQFEQSIARLVLWREDPEPLPLGGIEKWAHRLDVAVPTAREAVQRLMALGVVRTENGRGMVAEPLNTARTPETVVLQLRAAESPSQKRAALRDWLELEHYVAVEAISGCAKLAPNLRREVDAQMTSLIGLLVAKESGWVSDQIHYVIWYAANAIPPPLDLLANVLVRGHPIVHALVAEAIDAQLGDSRALLEPWREVQRALEARDTEQTRHTTDLAVKKLHEAVMAHLKSKTR